MSESVTTDIKTIEAERASLAAEIAAQRALVKAQGLDRRAPTASAALLATLTRRLAAAEMKLHAARKNNT